MIFYGRPGERVWDDELARRVCLFDHRGELETENEYVMTELLRRGYRSDRPGEAVYRVNAAHEEEPIEGAATVKVLFDAITGGDGKVTRKREGE